MTQSNQVEIYTDGSSKGNPGNAGYGIILKYGKHEKELSKGYRLSTNNRMELLAVIVGLEALKNSKYPITIYSDSKYVVEAIEKGWLWNWQKKGFKKKKNIDLWQRFIPLYKAYKPKELLDQEKFKRRKQYIIIGVVAFLIITVLYMLKS